MTRTLILAIVLAAAGCDDAPDPELPRCADTSQVLALPTPLWDDGERLAPPAGDAVAALVAERRPSWVEQVDQIDGWPARPTFVIPLSAAAEGIDTGELTLYGRAAPDSQLEALDIGFESSIEGDDATYAVIRPDRALPDLAEAVLAIGDGAIQGATALGACGGDGELHPDYDAARQDLPDPEQIQLAIPFRLASTHWQLPALGDVLAESPVLTVASVVPRELADFGEAAPTQEVAALLRAPAVSGILELPDYRGDDGGFEIDAGGLPEAQGITRPGFIVALPAVGGPPYPFVLFQHGGSQDKSIVFGLAGPLAAAGFALVAIDLPRHGDRSEDGSGGDLDILDFMDLIETRDNLRQASADHLAVLTGIEALNDAIEPALGVEAPLDPSRAFYMGLSLGGITGSLTFSSAPDLMAGALFVAAADYPTIVSDGLFSILLQDVLNRPTLEQATILGVAEVLLDGADPQSYALRAEDRDLPPRPLLLMQAIGDPIICTDSSDLWGLSFGADLARPFHHDVTGMEQLDLPASDNFTWNGSGQPATRLLVQNPMDEVSISGRHGGLIMQDYSQQMVSHCFTTLLETGSCEIIDTSFADH